MTLLQAILDMNIEAFTRAASETFARLDSLALAERMDTFQAFVNEQPQQRLAAFALSNARLWKAAAISTLEDDTSRIDDVTLASVAHLSDKLGAAHEARVDGYICLTCGHDWRTGKHEIATLGGKYGDPDFEDYHCEWWLDYDRADEYPNLEY